MESLRDTADSRALLIGALNKAAENGSFHVLNLIENKRPICVWGAGSRFFNAYERLFVRKGISLDYIVDSDPKKQGTEIVKGIACISPEELCQLEDPIVLPFLYAGNAFDEICHYCEKNKIEWIHISHFLLDMQDTTHRDVTWFVQQKERILQVYDSLDDEESQYVYAHTIYNRIAHGYQDTDYKSLCSAGEYFAPVNGYRLSNRESFLDVGAFEGDTIQTFLRFVQGKFSNIYAMEMSPKNYQKLLENTGIYPLDIKKKIVYFNVGAWCEKAEFTCGADDGGAACSINKGKQNFLKDDETEIAKCDRIDDLFYDKRVTLIKMDIEGAEIQALRGARNLIASQTPKMAICIYHNLSDYWEVPLLLKEIVPEFRLLIRHHSSWNGGTVCYAWKE